MDSAPTATPGGEKPQSVPSLSELASRLARLEERVEAGPDTDSLTLIVFSGELDKLLSAFVLATGAAACGMKVTMFFTFWGTAALKKGGPQIGRKSLVERAFGCLLPGGLQKRKLSRLDLGGLGRWLMRREMKQKNLASLDELIAIARESGIGVSVCEMSMSLMGIRREELIDFPNMKLCGVATALDVSSRGNTTLFI